MAIKPKVPKGTRDLLPRDMHLRDRLFQCLSSIFKRHGAVSIDTPVFELRHYLMSKYGEESKLVYDLADQGGELCSLRYDLTVPLARFMASNNLCEITRYHIAKVYRRDNVSRGRAREFFQCDFDIAGKYDPMFADFEVLKVLIEVLDALDLGQYEVKLNHRMLLDGILEICGVSPDKFRTICSSIDKLDKVPWQQVKTEMVNKKGLPEQVAHNIGAWVLKKGSPRQMLAELKSEGSPILQHSSSMAALAELELLFDYLQVADCLPCISFDLSLARGLDYYTGVIYEAVFKGDVQVGSIAAGGRYDNLIKFFGGKDVPAVGFSLGVERVLAILKDKVQKSGHCIIRSPSIDVLVVGLDGQKKVAVGLVNELWKRNIRAKFTAIPSKKLGQAKDSAVADGAAWMVIAGENELERGCVRLQNLMSREREDVRMLGFADTLQKRMGKQEEPAYVHL